MGSLGIFSNINNEFMGCFRSRLEPANKKNFISLWPKIQRSFIVELSLLIVIILSSTPLSEFSELFVCLHWETGRELQWLEVGLTGLKFTGGV